MVKKRRDAKENGERRMQGGMAGIVMTCKKEIRCGRGNLKGWTEVCSENWRVDGMAHMIWVTNV